VLQGGEQGGGPLGEVVGVGQDSRQEGGDPRCLLTVCWLVLFCLALISPAPLCLLLVTVSCCQVFLHLLLLLLLLLQPACLPAAACLPACCCCCLPACCCCCLPAALPSLLRPVPWCSQSLGFNFGLLIQCCAPAARPPAPLRPPPPTHTHTPRRWLPPAGRSGRQTCASGHTPGDTPWQVPSQPRLCDMWSSTSAGAAYDGLSQQHVGLQVAETMHRPTMLLIQPPVSSHTSTHIHIHIHIHIHAPAVAGRGPL
jgi:hypothetical protein